MPFCTRRRVSLCNCVGCANYVLNRRRWRTPPTVSEHKQNAGLRLIQWTIIIRYVELNVVLPLMACPHLATNCCRKRQQIVARNGNNLLPFLATICCLVWTGL